MSVKGCFTDFHIDFGGTSVWYHVFRGGKVSRVESLQLCVGLRLFAWQGSLTFPLPSAPSSSRSLLCECFQGLSVPLGPPPYSCPLAGKIKVTPFVSHPVTRSHFFTQNGALSTLGQIGTPDFGSQEPAAIHFPQLQG